MWRQTALAFVLSMTMPLGVAATVTHIEAVQRSERALEAREAQRLDKAAGVSRWQAEALTQAAVDRDAAQAKVAELQPALDAAKADNAKLKDQVAALQAVSYGLGAGPVAQSAQIAASGPVAFPYGYCTWYVASRRQVTWSGNAINWWWNARGIRPEGSQPQVGAIMVSRDSWWGHVSLVTSVVGDGSWWVSEMNWYGWAIVDSRHVMPGGTLIGFIY